VTTERLVCSWNHPLIPVNTFHYPGRPGRPLVAHCRHCRICQQRGVRAGQTLAQYYDSHPEALEYQGFPVAGAKVGRPT
jgi:hypothetical protein